MSHFIQSGGVDFGFIPFIALCVHYKGGSQSSFVLFGLGSVNLSRVFETRNTFRIRINFSIIKVIIPEFVELFRIYCS